MKATINFKVTIDNSNVNVNFDIPEKVEDMNLGLMKKIMDVMSGIEKRFKQQVALFYDEQNAGTKAETQENLENGNTQSQEEVNDQEEETQS